MISERSKRCKLKKRYPRARRLLMARKAAKPVRGEPFRVHHDVTSSHNAIYRSPFQRLSEELPAEC